MPDFTAMSIVVRQHDPNKSVSLIDRALLDASTSIASTSFVCVGDDIQVDEQEGFLRYLIACFGWKQPRFYHSNVALSQC